MHSPAQSDNQKTSRALNVLGAACALVFAGEMLYLSQAQALVSRTPQSSELVGASLEVASTHASNTTDAHREKPETPVEPRATKYELEGDAAASVKATNANGILTQAIGTFEDQGYKLAFVVHDIKTGHEICYDSDEELYPASSIKAPFTAAVYEKLVETGEVKLESVEPTAAVTILESSDEGYRALHSRYGERVFIEWLKDAGVEPGSYGSYESMVSWNYPHISARQLELMWVHIYNYLVTNTEPAKELAGFLERREVSSLRKALPKDVRSWSKMGWFDSHSEYRSEPATVEAGVVFDGKNPYVLAVITTAPAELDKLIPIHQALYRAHQDMV